MNARGDSTEHRLGPIAFDRNTRRFRAQCKCGQRFGPMSTAGMVHAAFEEHRSRLRAGRASLETPPED